MITIHWVINILVAGLVFGIIIFIHELGHFIAAKWSGVKVNEFALGMGPKLLKKQGKETLYSLRLFPVGGFCAMEGEDVESENPRALGSKPIWKRMIIMTAGALMNLLLGFVLLLLYCGVYTNMPTSSMDDLLFSTTIHSFKENAESENSGLRVGDKIIKINGKGTINFFEAYTLMQSDEDGVLSMTVERVADGKKQKVSIENVKLSRYEDEETGITYPYLDFIVRGAKKNVGNVIVESAKMEIALGRLIWRSLVDIITGKYGINDLSGPIGVVGVIGDAVDNIQQNGWEQIGGLVMMVIMITVNLGVFNLLPLPALDGGRLIFLIYEAIFRRPVNPKYEGLVHAIGLALLLLLMVVVAFSDIKRLIGG